MSLRARLAAVVAAARSPDHPHRIVRRQVIQAQASQAPTGTTLYLGDSNVEMALVDGFNAGIASARVSDIPALLKSLLPILRPDRVVVSVGVNDAQRARPFDLAAWRAAYQGVLHSAGPTPVMVMGIDPVEDGKPLGTAFFDPSAIAQQNAALAGLCEGAAAFVPPRLSSAGLTVDGVHNNADGFAEWRARLTL